MEYKGITRRSKRTAKSNEGSPYTDGKRKRKNSVPPVGKPKMPNMKKFDGYCFICHQLVQEELSCNACLRSFHMKCVKKKHIQFNGQGSCGDCQAQLLNGGNAIPGLNMSMLPELLEMVLVEALKDGVKKNNQKSQPKSKEENTYFKYFEVLRENSNLFQFMDLSLLVDNVKKKFFLTTVDFYSNVKLMYHNSYILYGVHSEFTLTALKMEKNIKKELLDLEACAECYYNKHNKQDHDFFTRICSEPHEIVWAKLRGSPYWPAKCMRISNGHADVTFFGTHDRSSIPLAQCYRISETSPNEKPIKQSKYHDAIEELEIYMDNYRAEYKRIPYFPLRTPLVDVNIVNLKKPNKRGRHRRSPSAKMADSSFSSEFNSPSAAGVQAKLDASDVASHLLPLNDCEMKGSKLPSKRSIELEPVSVSMTFTEDETYNHITPSTHVNMSQIDSSVSREYQTPVTSCLPIVVETPDFLPSTGTTFQNGSKHFINSGTTDFPVISSVDASLNSTFSNQLPETFEELHNFSNTVKKHVNIPNSEKDTWHQQSQDMNTSDYDDDDDDDDVQVINYIPPKLSKSLKSFANNTALMETICQLVFRNKPHLQELYNECMKMGHTAFIEFWLATVVEKHGESQVALFAKAFEKLFKEKEALEREKSDLIFDNGLFRQKVRSLQELFDQLHKEHNLLQEEYAISNEEKNNAARVALYIREGKATASEIAELEKMKKTHECNLEENKKLQNQLDETKISLSKKEQDLKKCMEKVLQLENKLKYLEKPRCTDSECQTVLSNLSENQQYSQQHFEEFKQAQSCSKHNLTKDDVIEKIEYTRQTITKDDSGDLEVTRETISNVRTYEYDDNDDDDEDEREGPPVNHVYPQIYGCPKVFENATTLSLECAMGPPSSVIASINPTSIILNPDYPMLQPQANFALISSSPKRNNYRQRNNKK